MKRKFWVGLVLTTLSCLALPVQAQWQSGNLAIRTNGNIFQSGDQLRVEIMALERITESFYTQVVYAFNETVEEKDEDGNVTYKQVERTRKRDTSPVIENLDKHQSLVLDDRFHFGDASPAGWYELRVCIFQAHTDTLMTVLRTCLFYQSSGADELSKKACDLFLRSIKRVNNEMFWTFDGQFKLDARYSVLLLRGNRVLKHLIGGGYASQTREFNLASAELEGLAGQSYDILVHDHQNARSSTLAKAAIPSAQ
jgi:hypothetical protein